MLRGWSFSPQGWVLSAPSFSSVASGCQVELATTQDPITFNYIFSATTILTVSTPMALCLTTESVSVRTQGLSWTTE
jgi:hypothetical protein